MQMSSLSGLWRRRFLRAATCFHVPAGGVATDGTSGNTWQRGGIRRWVGYLNPDEFATRRAEGRQAPMEAPNLESSHPD